MYRLFHILFLLPFIIGCTTTPTGVYGIHISENDDPGNTLSQQRCQSPEDIEAINRGSIEQVAHIKDKDAVLFLMLDPIFSEPEFEYEGYRDLHFIASVKRGRVKLMYAGIDEVYIWKLKQAGGMMGVAVPFSKGCAFDGYGEPDYLDKLMAMHETFLLIKRHGVDDASVRAAIKNIIMVSRYGTNFNESMVDAVIANLNAAKARIGKSEPTPEEIQAVSVDVKRQKRVEHELEPIKYAQDAFARGDHEAAYRLLEDGFISKYDEVREKSYQLLKEHPEIYTGAALSFSEESLTESLQTYGSSAREIESNRLSIYKKIATEKDYENALRNFERIFGKGG